MTPQVSETAEPGKRIHIGQLLYMFMLISRSFLCCFINKNTHNKKEGEKKFLKKKQQNV